jgi:hypothetical protein
MSPNAAGRWGAAGFQPKSTAVYTGAYINIGDLTTYFTNDSAGQLYETAGPGSQFLHSCFGERFIYSHNRSAYSAAGK